MSGPPPGTGGSDPGAAGADRIAAGLLLLTGAAHAALGFGGIVGLEAFEANADRFDKNDAWSLYASLGLWGAVMLLLGVGELLAARALWRVTPNGWLAAQISASCALAGVLLTFVIFRLASVLTIPLLLAAHYLLAYHSSQRPRS